MIRVDDRAVLAAQQAVDAGPEVTEIDTVMQRVASARHEFEASSSDRTDGHERE